LAGVQQALAQGQTNQAEQILDQLLTFSGTDANTMMTVASAYLSLRDFAKSEQAVQRLTQMLPEHSDSWYNLATIQFVRGENAQALVSLKKSLEINAKEVAANPKTVNLREHLFQDPNFAPLRQTPEFKADFGTKP
jgi:Flp pilus assembly protein TadD